MGILTKEVEVKVNGKTIEYYKSLGYKIPTKATSYNVRKATGKDFVYDTNKTFTVKVEDLQKRSEVNVDVLCDYCQKEILTMTYDQYTQRTKTINKIACKHCSPLKVKEVSLLRYGVDNYAKTEECHKKMESTMEELYGVKNPLQYKKFDDKRRQTCIERYGVEYALQSKEVQDKKRNTFIERYGVDSPSKIFEVKKKTKESLYKNGSQKTSKQQLYLQKIFGGELNYPIQYYNADICLLDEKIIIEYDGGGHDLNIKLGIITEKEFERKEIIRFNAIKKEGYKQIRIISSNDKLPFDEILLQMLSMAKEYFNTTSHSWINFDINNSRMVNVENKNIGGVHYDYGELRRIYNVK